MQHTIKHICGHTTIHQVCGDDLPPPDVIKHLESQDCQSCHFQSVMDEWRQKISKPVNEDKPHNFLLPAKPAENHNLSPYIEKIKEQQCPKIVEIHLEL